MSFQLTRALYSEEVTLCTLNGFPDQTEQIGQFFTDIAAQNINIDMIGRTAYTGKTAILSFSLADKDLSAVLGVISAYKQRFCDIQVTLSTGNGKFSFYSESMKQLPGFAAWVFTLLAQSGISLKLITTSTVDISVLVDGGDIAACCAAVLDKTGLAPSVEPL